MEFFEQDALYHTVTDRWIFYVKKASGKKYYLVFYFEDEKLVNIRYKYKIKQ